MNERLSKAEIESRFDSEYVLLDEPETDEHLNVLSGVVVFHSKDEDEVYRKAAELRSKRVAFLYTGKIPDDIVFIF
jgi:hypothetical protein